MGSRATIRLKHTNTDTAIHFYTHWHGGSIEETLAEGLCKAVRAGRANDQDYCSRIIFDTLTGCDGGETGYGIIVGDENIPADLQYDSPCVEWTEWGKDPVVRTFRIADNSLTDPVPMLEWIY